MKGGSYRTDLFARLLREYDAADATEYALIISLISLAIAGSVALFGTSLAGDFNRLASAIPAFSPK